MIALLGSHPAVGAKWVERCRQPREGDTGEWHHCPICTAEVNSDQSGSFSPSVAPCPTSFLSVKLEEEDTVTHMERSWGRKEEVGEKRLRTQEGVGMAVCGEHQRETGWGLVFSMTGKPHSRLPGFGSMDNCLYLEKYNQTILTYCLSFKHLILTDCQFLDGNFKPAL